MAGTPTWRRTAATASIIAALALAGCGGGGTSADPTPSGSGGGSGQLGDAPSGSPTTPGENPDASPGAGQGGGETPEVRYPSDAKAYADAILRAMAKPDYTRLGELGTPAMVQQIRDSLNSGGNPNPDWVHISCGAAEAPGSTDCKFRNAHGDQATITLVSGQVGYHNAATALNLDRTTYPANPVSYVEVFLSAWSDGNKQRMVRLSSESIWSQFSYKTPIGRQTTATDLGGGFTKVNVNGIGADYGNGFAFKVLSAPGGKAGAIRSACVTLDCTPA
jgi:hypothetical protein